MQVTITIPAPVSIFRKWRWSLLALLALSVIVMGGQGNTARAAFPGANGKIAFNTARDGNYEIYAMNADGSAQTRLTNNAASDSSAAWSPDGTKIAFDSNRDGNGEVFVMNADGTGPTNLTNNAASDESPAWSPDGTKIVFYSTRTGNAEVFVMNADGTGPANLTNNAAHDFEPAWSPDGTKIAFQSSRTGNVEVFVMNADGTGPTNLTNNAASDAYPDWSPDGTKIAFQSSRDGNMEVFVMNADGTGQTNRTNNAAPDSSTAWSPDGTKIAFDSNRTGNGEVFVMNADGTGPTNLTNNVAPDFEPAWQPLLPPQINITNLGQYALPKTCFQVRNSANTATFFAVCDNDFQGAPAANAVCVPDGICNDEDSAQGAIKVMVAAGGYRVVESKAAPQHTADASKPVCDATLTKCAVTFINTPNTRPWHPWDITGAVGGGANGLVRIDDVLAVVLHYHQDKPLP